jgi:hypothetical protein
MKKEMCFLLLLLLVISVSFVSSATDEISSKAYSCLENKVEGKCSSLTTEEKIFSLLAIGECKSELLSDSLSNQCWPVESCSVKSTAQAALALAKSGTSVQPAETWLLSKSTAFKDINWYLQVEANNESTCTVGYSGASYTFTVNEDRTISGRLGTCLTVYQDYWIKIASSCYDDPLTISCSNSFLTSLLYQKKNPTNSYDFYISDKTSSSSGGGSTTENVTSLCFSTRSSCDYEGTLWATIVLKYLGHDVSSYVPYLITAAEENSKYLPESFLYTLTNNFRTELLIKQQENQFWAASGDKFYDTAVALLPFQNEEVPEKESSKSWLGTVQGTDGCWQGGTRNTALILYSLWTKNINVTTSTQKNCLSSNYFCMSSASCSDLEGNVLSDYSGCSGTNICCDKEKQLGDCSTEGGELCNSGEQCLGGEDISSSDSTANKICCVGGTCGIQSVTQCESNGGNCRTSCSSNEKASSDACSSTTICCVEKKKSSAWIWLIIIAILIVLVLIGFIFRKKLRELFLKLKFGKGPNRPPTAGSPRFPPTASSRVYPGAVQRRILPPTQRTPVRTALVQRAMPVATPAQKTVTTKTVTVKPIPQKSAVKTTTTKTTTKKTTTKESSSDILKKLKAIGK